MKIVEKSGVFKYPMRAELWGGMMQRPHWAIAGILSMAISLVMIAGCTKKSDSESKPESASKGSEISIGLVLDKGGKDDKSFNSAAVVGATLASKEFGIKVKDVESPDDTAFEPALRTFAERGLPLVVSIGFAQADALKKVAPLFPNTKFAIVDAVVDAPNVASLMFDEHEGSFLVGYLAGLASKTANVGFVGGMEVALIRRFLMAYEAGVKAANSKAKVQSGFVGITAAAWANPTRGKELAMNQIGQGADIIFHAAGASGIGVFDAVEEKFKPEKPVYVIGVDSNQNGLKPGKVLTSMLKRVDTAVYTIIAEVAKGTFKPGLRSFGLKDKGIDYAVDANNDGLIAPYKDKLEDMRSKIMSGSVKVPDFYKTGK